MNLDPERFGASGLWVGVYGLGLTIAGFKHKELPLQ